MRPKPTVLLKKHNHKTNTAIEVIKAEGLYIVCLEGEPISMRSLNYGDGTSKPTSTGGGIKYPRSCFANPGHAFHLRDKLNTMFNTDEFSVMKCTRGKRIDPPVE